MIIADKVKETITNTKEGVILTIADFQVEPQYQQVLVMSLSRKVRTGELKKISKGKYYKPKNSISGTLPPSFDEVIQHGIHSANIFNKV